MLKSFGLPASRLEIAYAIDTDLLTPGVQMGRPARGHLSRAMGLNFVTHIQAGIIV